MRYLYDGINRVRVGRVERERNPPPSAVATMAGCAALHPPYGPIEDWLTVPLPKGLLRK